MVTHRNIYKYGYNRPIYFLAPLAEKARRNDPLVAMSTPWFAQIRSWFLMPFPKKKETRAPWKVADAKTGAGNTQDEPGEPSGARK